MGHAAGARFEAAFSARAGRTLALAHARAPAGHACDAFSSGDGILGVVCRHRPTPSSAVPVAGYTGGDACAGPVRISSSIADGQGAGAPARRVSLQPGEYEAPADRTGAAREAGIAGAIGLGSRP